MPEKRFELSRPLRTTDFESAVSTDSTTLAKCRKYHDGEHESNIIKGNVQVESGKISTDFLDSRPIII